MANPDKTKLESEKSNYYKIEGESIVYLLEGNYFIYEVAHYLNQFLNCLDVIGGTKDASLELFTGYLYTSHNEHKKLIAEYLTESIDKHDKSLRKITAHGDYLPTIIIALLAGAVKQHNNFNEENALRLLTKASYFMGLMTAFISENQYYKKVAKAGAKIKHENSDHAKAKTEILKAWKAQREVIIAKRGKAQFCRDMQNQYKDKDGNDLIKDVKTIQGWITDWERNLL